MGAQRRRRSRTVRRCEGAARAPFYHGGTPFHHQRLWRCVAARRGVGVNPARDPRPSRAGRLTPQQIHSHLTPRCLLQFQTRPVQEDDGHAVNHAVRTYRDFPDAFREIQSRGFERDLGWNRAAELYEDRFIDAKYSW